MVLEVGPVVECVGDGGEREGGFAFVEKDLEEDVAALVFEEDELEGGAHRDVVIGQNLQAFFQRRGAASVAVYIQKDQQRSEAGIVAETKAELGVAGSEIGFGRVDDLLQHIGGIIHSLALRGFKSSIIQEELG